MTRHHPLRNCRTFTTATTPNQTANATQNAPKSGCPSAKNETASTAPANAVTVALMAASRRVISPAVLDAASDVERRMLSDQRAESAHWPSSRS
jgi:DNA topoisomerase IB